ncbi:hypothetical protein [Maribacter aestuarii]|uniref:hypothetical protein n=1 Tax=Maribacter aestuarii TaxID=1130723 RepID=UPI00248BA14B|nr:hypothetical protein [Maribacter aestuarii]
MLNKAIVLVFLAGFLILSMSCRKDFDYSSSQGDLTFSKDTVYLDTIFSNIGSSTYSLTVYNRSKEDVIIPSIRLEKGNKSNYRLNVDGSAGKSFTNVPLFARDSLYIYIEITIDIENNSENSLLYTDVIQFDSGSNQQNIPLVTLVKDATFLYPGTNTDGTKETITLSTDANGNEIKVQGFVLDDDHLNFLNDKPYVIYGYAVVPEGKVLVINAGVRVHFHQNSGILIQDGGVISINGVLSEDEELLNGEVIFEGDRLEPQFSDIPGQWGSLWIAKGSQGNTINHLTLRNANIGLFVEGDDVLDSPTLYIKNSQFYNSATYNLFANGASIAAENVVIGSAGISSLHCQLGGNYTFVHSTIANYWNKGFRNTSTIVISNYNLLNPNEASDLIKADFKNCIIDGINDFELSLLTDNQNAFEFNFMNCFLKFSSTEGQLTNPLFDFESSNNYSNLILNGQTDFFNPYLDDFRIGLDSDVVNAGDSNVASTLPLDILGKERSSNADLGAYQAASKE